MAAEIYTRKQVTALGLAVAGPLRREADGRHYKAGGWGVGKSTVHTLRDRGLFQVRTVPDGAELVTLTARGRELMGVRSAPRGGDQ